MAPRVPLQYSHRTRLDARGLRHTGMVDLHARMYDAQGKSIASRVVSVERLPAVQRILGMLLDCSSWPAIGYRDAATCDETATANLDVWKQLSWGDTQPYVNSGDQNKLAINPRNILGLTFNGNPFRAYGFSQNNAAQSKQVYQAFKYISAQMKNMPISGSPPNNAGTGAGVTYQLQCLKNGFVSFDGLTSKTYASQTPGWSPHDSTLFAVTALGANGLQGSRANYMYIGGTIGAPTTVFVDLSQGYFAGNTGTETQGAINVSLVKYQMGDEIEWATVTIDAGTATAAVTATFSSTTAVTQEDDYAIRIDYENPADARGAGSMALNAGNNIDPSSGGVLIGAQPIQMGFWGQCAMTMTWHAIPEISWMLTEGIGYRGLAMHLRLYYNGPEGSNGAPNGNLAAAKLQEPSAWRELRDKCHNGASDNTYSPMQDLAVYGPNRDEMMHIAHENTHGLRYSEKITDLPQFQKLQQPWLSTVNFLTEEGQAPWCDGIVESAEYLYGDYTAWTIDVMNLQSGAAGATQCYASFFGMELSWAIERRVVRQSIPTRKTPARAKDWSDALEYRSSLPWAAADSGYSVMDWMYHRNVQDLIDENTSNMLLARHLDDYGPFGKVYRDRGYISG